MVLPGLTKKLLNGNIFSLLLLRSPLNKCSRLSFPHAFSGNPSLKSEKNLDPGSKAYRDDSKWCFLSWYLSSNFSLLFLFILSVFVFVFGEKEESIIPQIEPNDKDEHYAKIWDKYGAYYDINDLIITQVTDYGKYKIKFDIHKRIKILNANGLKFATVPVYQYAQMMPHFQLTLRDEKGNMVPLDQEKIKKEYRQTGKIVFPRVKAGMALDIRISFIYPHVYFRGYSHYFYTSIPARINRFVWIYSKNSPCEMKDYGYRFPIIQETLKHKRKIIKIFSVNDYIPKSDLSYQDYFANTEPFLVVRLIKLAGEPKKFNSEKYIFSAYAKKTRTTLKRIPKAELQPITLEYIDGISDPKVKAELILLWVQDKILSQSKTQIKPEDILKYGKGTQFQVACLCNKMFRIAGLSSDLVYLFSKRNCKLDPDFLFYTNTAEAFPLVTIENKRYIAYPFAKGFEFGEYHEDYYDVYCINPGQKKVEKLPVSRHNHSDWEKITHIIDPQNPSEASLLYSYKKNSANYFRNELLEKNKEARRKYFEKRLKKYSKNNELQSFKIKNIDEYEKSLEIEIKYSSDNTPLLHEKTKIVRLNNYFLNRFSDIDMERKLGVFIHDNNTDIEEIIIKKIPGKTIIPDMKMKELTNELFTVKVESLDSDTSLVFKRRVTYNKCYIKPEDLKSIYQDCVELNNVKNSHIAIK